MTDQQNVQSTVQERFAQLPRVVQDAITSTDTEKHLRGLADSYKLHLDQWETLENEVMMALFGVTPIDLLQQNIKSQVGVSEEAAQDLTRSIMTAIFEPIRQKLEHSLEHPDAKGESPTETAQAETLAAARAEEAQPASTPAPIQPATPPAPTPDVKITRPSDSTAYKPGEASATRKSVGDDPYRESVA